MCGICGIATREVDGVVAEPRLVAMRDALVHRGPDDAGVYRAPGIGLGSRRLAILDLSERGHMPMSTPDGRFWIVYNGEVYNYRDLRAGLESRGHRFRSDSDTEVLLDLFADQGPSMLDRLNGMFALAIWDSRERTLFLARDRLGVKPLYYCADETGLRFASEQKALFAAGDPAEFDTGTWSELLCFGYVAGERTPFHRVTRLLPGHYMLWSGGRAIVRRWWNLSDRVAALRDSPPSTRTPEWFRDTFDDAVRLRRISDVPVGIFLSGGLDSSSVAAALAAQDARGLASFTVRFGETGYDEGPLAREVAHRCGLEYHDLAVTPVELSDGLVRGSWLRDEPLAHASDLHIHALSRYAKPRVTVLLSGEGADETMGGYVRYRPLRYAAIWRAARPILRSGRGLAGRLGKLARLAALAEGDEVLFNACDVLPNDLEALGLRPEGDFEYRRAVLSEARSVYPDEPVRQAMYSDQHTFLGSILDRNDRMTMGASIECRVPFLDYRLVEGLASLPTSSLFSGFHGKAPLRRSLGERLPGAVRRHRKWGFGVPWDRYLRSEPRLRDRVAALADREPIRGGPLRRDRLLRVIDDFLSGDSGATPLIWTLVMITAWAEACLRPAAVPTGRG